MHRVRTNGRTAQQGRRTRGAHAAERPRGSGGLRRLLALLLLVPVVAVQGDPGAVRPLVAPGSRVTLGTPLLEWT